MAEGYEAITAELDAEQSGDGTQAPIEGQDEYTEDQGQPEGQTQEPAPQSDWDGSQWQLKYRDQTIVPKDREHLIALAQQGYSYSSRMKELKDRESELEGMKGKYSQYEQLEAAFEKNPEFRQQILQWYQQSTTPGQQQQPQGQPAQGQGQVPPEILKEIQELKGWKQQFESYQASQQQAAADGEVENEIKTLQEKYPRDDWDVLSSTGKTFIQEVIEHAYKNGGIKLETAYRDLAWDQNKVNTAAESSRGAGADQARAKKAGVAAGGKSRGAVPPSQVNPAGMDYGDIEKHIKAEYNIH